MAKIAETPLMKQYLEMKRKHPDAILLFRVGDFYETFSDDAVETSRILGITLTRRANGSAQHVELAGFPHHALDTYLPKLVRAGKRVAICEQLEDPKLTKKLVKRGITELITPGVNTRPGALNPGENNFLAGVHFIQRRPSDPMKVGLAFLDITTGEFLTTETTPATASRLLNAIRPREVLRMRGTREVYEHRIDYRSAVNELEDWVYTSDAARQRLTAQFGTVTLKGFGIDHLEGGVIAAASLLHYLDQTAHSHLDHITSLSHLDEGQFMSLDRFTMRNLEILHPLDSSGKSLFNILCRTLTPMGERQLRQWLAFPLLDLGQIRRRQDCIEGFFRDPELREHLATILPDVGDLARNIGRIAEMKASPRDVALAARSAECAVRIKKILSSLDISSDPSGSLAELKRIGTDLPDLSESASLIRSTLSAEPPVSVEKGGVIAPGVSLELDELRALHTNARQGLEEICRRESERTGITSLKLLTNTTFGYSLEVRNTHRDKVPADWTRKQTLVNAERYVTPELRSYEEKIQGAEERIRQLEDELFSKLLADLIVHIPEFKKACVHIADLDCLLALAVVAAECNYVRPVVDDSFILDIREGRHPVIERMLPPGEPYISNNVLLDPEQTQIMMITGPNMSGKSALLRQTALIALMAQTGSFVPAESARIGLVDKIFTRVGASDNISSGESTFMVEMTEAASILNNMGARSLVLFDELGRGTSTYDGISIAWAVVEHIHDNGRSRPRTLFATHYHELNEMEGSYGRIKNFNVSVREIQGKVVFLRKLRPGGSEHSFGIHVARLAGLPPATIKRAEEVLKQLEAGKHGEAGHRVSKETLEEISAARASQTSLFQPEDPLLNDLRDRLLDIDIDRLTPLEALTMLHDLQTMLH